jgi:organic hydroperoxide reductase OsmC/OhrA
MLISATLTNIHRENEVTVSTGDNKKKLIIPSKPLGKGSSVSGGELLFLALATCFCNDIYREAARRDMEIIAVEVIVKGEFGKEGEPASNITCEAKVESPSSTYEEIAALIKKVDEVAEVHNTLRYGTNISLRIPEHVNEN